MPVHTVVLITNACLTHKDISIQDEFLAANVSLCWYDILGGQCGIIVLEPSCFVVCLSEKSHLLAISDRPTAIAVYFYIVAASLGSIPVYSSQLAVSCRSEVSRKPRCLRVNKTQLLLTTRCLPDWHEFMLVPLCLCTLVHTYHCASTNSQRRYNFTKHTSNKNMDDKSFLDFRS